MNRKRVRIAVPSTLVGFAVGAACSAPTSGKCEPVQVSGASVRTWQCKDGRTCNPPDQGAVDGGVYQSCPGSSECITLVTYEGAPTETCFV